MIKKKYWVVVDEIIRKSDLILNILDSRFYDQTRNNIIEAKIRRYRKKFIFILNKSDLTTRKELKKAITELKEIAPIISISSKERHGKLRLLGTILKLVKKRPLIIAVVGYPNTGKSSLINYLKGKKSARISPEAGFTRGKQYLRITKNIMMIDTPGVIPYKEKNKLNLFLKSAITKVEDPEDLALQLLEVFLKENPKTIEERYSVKIKDNSEELLIEIAKQKKKLKKGGLLDLRAAAEMIINDYRKGKIKK